MTIEQFNNNLRTINPMQLLFDVANEIKQPLVDKTLGNLEIGRMPDGSAITSKYTGKSTYSSSWSKERKARGLQVSFFDLRYTGDLYKALYIKNVKKGTSLNLSMTVNGAKNHNKLLDLGDMFGSITGFTEDAMKTFKYDLEKGFVAKLKQRMFAK